MGQWRALSAWEQKPSCCWARCGVGVSEPQPEDPGDSSAETTSPFVPVWLSRQLPSQDNREAASFYRVNGPHCGLFEYLMISFAFPEKELGEGCSVRYKLWAARLWLTRSRLASPFPSRSIPKLKTPTDGSRLRMWQREEPVWVVSDTGQQPWRGRGDADPVSGDHSTQWEGNQRLVFHSRVRVWLKFRLPQSVS